MSATEYRDDYQEGLPTPTVDGDAMVRFHKNEKGRDFVVGDIHGMFTYLERLLDEVNFSESDDRLFSVGDLVDRGPESKLALDWMGQSWFHACRGNHEQFVIDSEDPEQYDVWVNYNGGEWWLQVPEDDHERFRQSFNSMPLAMEVATESGTVGIVHADVPPFLSWEQFVNLLESNDRDATLYALWSRNRISGLSSAFPVTGGVERVYCGHTPTRCTVQLENVYYIDTGAVYIFDGYEDARLTLIEIHPEPHREYGISTGD